IAVIHVYIFHHTSLLITRYHHRRRTHYLSRIRILIHVGLQENLRTEDGQEALPLQHLFPEVRRGRTRRVSRVPRGTGIVVAAVERQEVRLLPSELRGHVHLVVVDGEVHQRARAEAEPRLTGRVGILPVLRDGRAPLLLEERLQLAGRHRQTVDEEDEIDRPFISSLRREVDLTGDAQPHLFVLLAHGFVQCRRRLELAHPEVRRRPARVRELPTQHVEHPAARQRRSAPSGHEPRAPRPPL